ncbi:dTDP-4-dehydrorhamnose reductase [Shinella sp. CPCC 101442]|uniref:dTDP-4-dehydrorhamnose reductase n=1 Tax=Shinella sp. CPCC 101442 TaxID=2932265 RepID=UPI0021538D27|nr:dTDP-4-dehydrorhamnose reductase [Shinella sp. CPCC 101442]MCR6502400.1 dTDP-4-dehydrorhamnose reductase [Shinella sp. CPCC 101442]
MRIVVTGREGQIARSLAALGPQMNVEIIPIGRPELDLVTPGSIMPALATARPDAIISAAAYTMVDKAETERDLAFAVNGIGAGAVAEAAARLGVPLLHLSTDYVFDGRKPTPYVETDRVGPICVYGASKIEGERRAEATVSDLAILRTAWVYSPYANNFLKTMLKLGETHDKLVVVADQLGCPTSAEDIARTLITVARRMVGDRDRRYRGIFHLAGAGEASWAEFAREIFSTAESFGRSPVEVVPITSDQYPSPVKRPANSRLSGEKLARIYGIALPDWRTSTRKVIETLLGCNHAQARSAHSGGRQ